MKHLSRGFSAIVAIALIAIVAGCSSAGATAPSQAVVQPTPKIVYVTPAPTVKPTAVPTAKPTPTVAPTRDWAGEIDSALDGDDCEVTRALTDDLLETDMAIKTTLGRYGELLSAALECLGVSDTATPAYYKIGETVPFTDDTSCEVDITPTAVKAWKSNNSLVRPAKNKRFVTVQVVVRPTKGADECEGIGYVYFGIESTDGYVYESEPAWRDPQLPYDSNIVAKNGKAIKGWITFELPKTLKKGFLTYGDAEWAFTVK